MRSISYLKIPATGKNVIQKIYPGHQTSQSQAKNSHARLVIYLGIASYLANFSQGKESVGAFFFFFFVSFVVEKIPTSETVRTKQLKGHCPLFIYLFILFFK